MDSISGIGDYLRKKVKKFFKKDTEEGQGGTESSGEIGSYSMNEGDTGTIFGINQKLVKLLVVGIGALFLLAILSASSPDTETAKEDNKPKTGNTQPAMQGDNGMPDNYADWAEEERKKKEETDRLAAERNKNKTPEPKKEQPKPEQTTPKIPANYSQLPRITIPSNTPAQVPQQPPKDERLNPEIAFAWGGQSNGGIKTVSQAAEETGEAKEKMSPQYIPPNNSTLTTGTIIPVRLLTGINTDVLGQVMAQVISDVYDSTTGTNILIPQGSKITGIYDRQAVANGRVPLVFRQINFPDGGSWTLGDSLVAVDGPGYAGAKGKIHHHTGQKVSAGLLGSAIAALASVGAGNTSSNSNTYTAGQLATQGAVANLINVTSDMFKKASDVVDTVTIEPGYEFNLYVTENLSFGQ